MYNYICTPWWLYGYHMDLPTVARSAGPPRGAPAPGCRGLPPRRAVARQRMRWWCFFWLEAAKVNGIYHIMSYVYAIHQYTSIYINIHRYTSIYINIHQYTSIYINIHYNIYIYMYTYILDWMSFSLTAFTFVRFNPRTCYGLRAPVNTIIILVVAVYNHVIFGEINHAWSVQRVQEYASNRPRNFHGYWIGQKCGCSQCNNGVCPNRSASFLFLSQPQNSREKCDVSCTVHVVFLILLRFLIDIESFLCKGSRPQTLVDHCW